MTAGADEREDRRMHQRWTGLLIVATLGAAAGCSGSDSPPAAAPTTAAAPAPEPTAAAPTPAPAPTSAPVTTVPPTTVPPTTAPATSTTVASALARVVPPEASTVAELLALDRPIVIAHAGGDFESPHSTMYAYTQAALAGADVLELDVMLTADRVLVVQHDDTVDRTTEATGPVRELTYDELSALDNAYWFSGDTWSDHSLPESAYVLRGVRTGDRPPPPGYSPDDFRVETFRSIAEAFPGHVLDVEIKVPSGADGQPDLAWAIEGAKELAAEVAELGRTDSVVGVSFDDSVVAAFREAAPGVATSPGLSTLVAWYGGAKVDFAPTDVVFQVPPFFQGIEVLTPDVIARAAADGFPIWVWMDDTTTQENPTFYADLLSRGIEGLLISRPAEAIAFLAS